MDRISGYELEDRGFESLQAHQKNTAKAVLFSKVMKGKVKEMEKLKVFDEFYLDKEKDVIVKLYRISKDEIEYILETPNHKKGTLITNLAQICHLET